MRFVTHRELPKRVLIVVMCLLVFIFAVQAHIHFHGKGFVSKVQPHERTKLRPEGKMPQLYVPSAVVFWLGTAAAYFLLFRGHPVIQRSLLVLIPRDRMPQYHRQTFLRPPPCFSH